MAAKEKVLVVFQRMLVGADGRAMISRSQLNFVLVYLGLPNGSADRLFEGMGTGQDQVSCEDFVDYLWEEPDYALGHELWGTAKAKVDAEAEQNVQREAASRARRQRWRQLADGVEDQEEQQMPRVNFLRLMAEFRKVEKAIVGGDNTNGLVRCEPVEDNLMEWEADMCFPPGSDLQCGLDQLAANAGDPSENYMTLRMRFPLDFPASPPEVWLRRPRLRHGSGPVSFGGRLCSQLLGSDGWRPATSMLALFGEVQQELLDNRAEVDNAVPVRRKYLPPPLLEHLKSELFPTANGFEKHAIKVISPETAEPFLGNMARLEATDKIALPFEYADEIYDQVQHGGELDLPLLFEVKTCLGRKRHCAIFDFIDGLPNAHVLLPKWVMESVCLKEGELVTVRGVRLELISYVKVQPHSVDFYRAVGDSGREVGEILTESLSRFSALTEDTNIPIEICGQPLDVQITELRPRGAVRIIDSDVQHYFDFKVDFEAAPDLEDEAAMRARQEKLIAQYKAQRERQEKEKQSQEERRRAAIKRHFEELRERARTAAGESICEAGPVKLALRMPDGSQVKARVCENAPVLALIALALDSAWAERCKPWGLRLRTMFPVRMLSEDELVKDMHRSIVNVQEEAPPELDDDLFALSAVACGAGEVSDDGASNLQDDPLACVSLSPPPLQRNISEIQRRTQEAFEIQRFIQSGVDPQEAVRRYRAGEVLRPTAASMCAGPPPPVASMALAPAPPRFQRSLSEEERRTGQVEMVMNFTGVDQAAAIEALEACDWNIELAANHLLGNNDD